MFKLAESTNLIKKHLKNISTLLVPILDIITSAGLTIRHRKQSTVTVYLPNPWGSEVQKCHKSEFVSVFPNLIILRSCYVIIYCYNNNYYCFRYQKDVIYLKMVKIHLKSTIAFYKSFRFKFFRFTLIFFRPFLVHIKHAN